MAGLLRVACRSSSLLLGLRSGEAAAAVSGALETRSGRTSSSTTSSDASGVGGGVSGATGDAVARYTDILGCSISRSSSGDVSTFTGPARVKHAGGVTYHDSSSAVAPSTVEFKHRARSQSVQPKVMSAFNVLRPITFYVIDDRAIFKIATFLSPRNLSRNYFWNISENSFVTNNTF